MPSMHVVTVQNPVHTVLKNERDEPVLILQEKESDSEDGPRVYVHYVNLEKRNDEWILKSLLQPMPSTSTNGAIVRSRKRKRSSKNGSASLSRDQSIISEEEGWSPGQEDRSLTEQTAVEEVLMTEEDYDIQHHKQIYARRNFDNVRFGEWVIKTWYFSPYPLTENEDSETSSSQTPNNVSAPRIPGVSKTNGRSHGRTSDMLAGGMGRKGERSLLYVCDMCFKYMTDGSTWEAHKSTCPVLRPPGRKVYQRGAHTIWEVDGTKAKLYCQNLSLFGKLFIDIKTLFFDCDNFLFYILTDATSTSDHMLGYFSKEKMSYDDYNLACIITLPPFQRKGFGMLMIEFSYELSRRAGRVGTPERPLSDLGLRSYLAYWVSTLLRFFRKLLEVVPMSAGTDPLITQGTPPDFRSPTRELSSEDSITPRRRKRNKGWDGEVSQEEGEALEDIDGARFPTSLSLRQNHSLSISLPPSTSPSTPCLSDKLASLRTFVTTRNPDGSASVHLKIQCSLVDIANATHLRVEDTAFALNEMGMLTKWGQGPGEEKPGVILTRGMVEKIIEERQLKNPCMDYKHVLL